MVVCDRDDIPVEYEQAAEMLGASRWWVIWEIILPLLKPGLAVTFLFLFILNWSEFLLAVVLTEKTVVTITVNMFLYSGVAGIQAALATIAALPIVIVGLLIHQHLARGFTLGAVKR